MSNVMVSVICIAYNQEKYIGEAIESFLMQKTNFTYEILVHDDASTDKTADIIREYEKKYPELIKPIYQTENQYSKGIQVTEVTRQQAKGKYFALCEGDDYWTDPNKLQKQVDFLENNPEYSLCVHEALKVDAITGKKITSVKPSKISRDFSVEEIIYGGGSLFATNSMVYRKPERNRMAQFVYDAPVGDYPLAIYLGLSGKVFYLNTVMSNYRGAVEGSWSTRKFKNKETRKLHFEKIEIMLEDIDLYTKGAYSKIIKKTIVKNKFNLAIEQGDFSLIREGELGSFYDELSKIAKIKLFYRRKFPKLYSFLNKVRKVLE